MADGLTKPRAQAASYKVLTFAYHESKVEQCIIRDP